MKFFFKNMLLGALLTSSMCLHAHNQKQMLTDLETIKHSLQTSYAPAQWKKHLFGWDLEAESKKAKTTITTSVGMTTKDFQRIIKEFLNSTRDYHVSVRFYSTERASLPFRVKGCNGKYFISFIDSDKLNRYLFPFSEGDELLLFDGKPVDDVIRELKNGEMSSNPETDQGLAEIYLTRRLGKLGHVVPQGTITITALPNGSLKPLSYQLVWNYKPEKVTALKTQEPMQLACAKSLNRSTVSTNKEVFSNPIFQKLLLTPYWEDKSLDDEDDDRLADILGNRKSFIPALGKLWWSTSPDSPFDAYLFELSDHKLVGYVRIPSYMPAGLDDVDEFARIISFMEDRSNALVIDQVDNPGGSVFYLYALASMLTDQPLATPRHRMAITQADVYAAASIIPIFESINSDSEAQEKLGYSVYGLPVTHQLASFILNYFYFIVDEWNNGNQLTTPHFLYGVDHINPHPYARYTKPILVLVNSLAFSGGDFFPAILQDNQRATIMGTRTAGAGGFVSTLAFPNLNGIASIRFTGSIAERTERMPIENLGVTPDIPCKITEDDLRYNYVDYVSEVRNVLEQML